MQQNRISAILPVRLRAILIAVPVFLLAACGARIEQTVTFYAEEAWEADMSIGLSGEAMSLIGALGQLNQEMDKAVAEMQAAGVEAEWEFIQEDDGISRYVIHAQGSGYDTLNGFAFDNRADIFATMDGGQRQINFSYALSRDWLDAELATITLVGGEIVQSNGQRLGRSTVQWTQPRGRMEAVLTEKSRFPGGSLLLVGGLLVGLVTVVGGARAVLKRRQQPAYCLQCGRKLAPHAQFCPYCGAPR